MALIICPECGNECSIEAVSCPSCGKPFAPVAKRQITVISREKEFPKWIIVPITILGVILLFFVFFLVTRDNETANANIKVRVADTPIQRKTEETTGRNETHEVVTTSNPGSREVVVTNPNPVSPPITQTQVDQPLPTPVPNKAVVKVSAKVFTKNGNTRPVAKEKFYLLDKDLDTILSEANINDEEGQGLKNAFALSIVNPGKYRETNQKALAAIKKHIVYSTVTDSQGNAEIKSVKPDNYYLFAISATANSYAIWDSQITIQIGENELMLEPQTLTEVSVDASRLSLVRID